MNAQEALALTNNNAYRKDAVEYAIKYTEGLIERKARIGERSCLVDFHSHPGGYLDFEAKYGAENSDNYHLYDVEKEMRNHFEGNGFKFVLVRDFISGGVRQDPFWEIRW